MPAGAGAAAAATPRAAPSRSAPARRPSFDPCAFHRRRLAAEEGDQFFALIRDAHVVDAGAPGVAAPVGLGGQLVADLGGRQELAPATTRYRGLIVRVSGICGALAC